jgi:putative FmdB family regulatory protein
MPTYEYECEACGHKFEKFQTMSDKPVRVCPECKKRKVQRLMGTGAGIIFKGSGFYETDYKRKSSSGSSSSSSGAGSSSNSDGSGTESKPATKPDSGSPASAKSDS